MSKIIGKGLNNMPWQDRPENYTLPVWRYNKNPIINRRPIEGVSRVFNSSVIPYEGKFIGIFRGDTDSGVPYLYLGKSPDGINFTYEKEPIAFLNENGERYKFEYAYDPRLIEVEGRYYIVWCDSICGKPAIGLGYTDDFKKFYMIGHPFLPCNRNGVMFPKKINGEYVMLSRPSDAGHTPFGDIYISYSKDLVYWGKHKLLMCSGYEWWQGLKIGAGAVPIETDEGWLILYHGVTQTCAGYVYSMGGAVLDKDDPSKVKYRCTNFILTPEEDYETTGFVPNVVFPCSAICDADTGRIAIYYGGADTYVNLAFTDVDTIMSYIKKNAR